MMKVLNATFMALFFSTIAMGQDHGHSHGAGGEIEHLYPILGIIAALVVGGLFLLYSKKK